MEAIFRIAVAFATLGGLAVVWFGLQAVIRRWVPSMVPPDGGDPFRTRFGCGGSCSTGECGADHTHAKAH